MVQLLWKTVWKFLKTVHYWHVNTHAKQSRVLSRTYINIWKCIIFDTRNQWENCGFFPIKANRIIDYGFRRKLI